MALSALIVALVVAFIVANVWVEVVNEGMEVHWWRTTLSDYMTRVRGAAFTSLIYIGLVAAEVLVIFNHSRGVPATVCLVVAAAGLLGVVVTAHVMARVGWIGTFHYVLAGFAFVASLASEAVILWPRPEVGFVAGGVATVIGFCLFAPQRTALAEKLLTLWLLAGLLALWCRPCEGSGLASASIVGPQDRRAVAATTVRANAYEKARRSGPFRKPAKEAYAACT